MLTKSGKRLDRLEHLLSTLDLGDDAMLVSEFDGFAAGLAVCPDLIPPSMWLDAVWGEESPVFDSRDAANEILRLIMEHYNDVGRRLGMPGKYTPCYMVDHDGSLLWELWASGFARAMDLSPDPWSVFEEVEDDAVNNAALFMQLICLIADLPPGELDERHGRVAEEAPNLIPGCIEILHEARRAMHQAVAPAPARRESVGRNDPCPCGSGKKYKKCCLN